MKQKIARYFGLQNKPSSGQFFVSYIFFCFTYFVFCAFVSLTAVRISRSVYFFTSEHYGSVGCDHFN